MQLTIEERVRALEERMNKMDGTGEGKAPDASIFDSPEWKQAWEKFDEAMGAAGNLFAAAGARVRSSVKSKL